MAYNLTTITTNATLLSFTQGTNTILMNGFLGLLLLIGIGVIMFSSFMWSTRDVKSSLVATTFLLFGLSVLMRAIDLVPNVTLFVTLIACALTIAFTWRR